MLTKQTAFGMFSRGRGKGPAWIWGGGLEEQQGALGTGLPGSWEVRDREEVVQLEREQAWKLLDDSVEKKREGVEECVQGGFHLGALAMTPLPLHLCGSCLSVFPLGHEMGRDRPEPFLCPSQQQHTVPGHRGAWRASGKQVAGKEGRRGQAGCPISDLRVAPVELLKKILKIFCFSCLLVSFLAVTFLVSVSDDFLKSKAAW